MPSDRCELLCLDLSTAERLRQGRLDLASAELAAGGARALGDTTRLTLAAALTEVEELCVCDLALDRRAVAEPRLASRTDPLRAHGIVRSRRDGKMVMYSLTEEGRGLVDAVLTARETAAV